MAQRRGRKLIKVESRRGLDTMQSAGWLEQAINQLKPVPSLSTWAVSVLVCTIA